MHNKTDKQYYFKHVFGMFCFFIFKTFSKVLWQLIAKLAMCFRSIQTSSNKQRIIVLHFENKIRSKNQVSNIFCERNIVTHNINWPNVSANVLRHQQIEL